MIVPPSEPAPAPNLQAFSLDGNLDRKQDTNFQLSAGIAGKEFNILAGGKSYISLK